MGFFCPLLSEDLPLAVPLSPQREVNWTTVFVLSTMFYGDGQLCNREPVIMALTETFPLCNYNCLAQLGYNYCLDNAKVINDHSFLVK